MRDSCFLSHAIYINNLAVVAADVNIIEEAERERETETASVNVYAVNWGTITENPLACMFMIGLFFLLLCFLLLLI